MKEQVNVKEFLDLTIEEIFADRFARYSKYIIQDRALPDVRDGLKPVQRRILYAMYKDGNTFNKPFRKSAKTVGNVIGNYHPHGDSSVYEAMVRMSQTWKVNEQLVVMHGNNGSIDGDSAAAMRYTEAKMSEYAQIMLENIDEETVNMIPNFDDTELEPTVLPTRIPNLLINGATGISAGYATDIPPHNPVEVIKGAILLNENPETTIEELIKVIPAPDFPTGGIIQGKEGLEEAYRTGKGKIVVRGEYEIKKNNIIIKSIPYEVNKSTLLQKFELIRLENKVSGINEILDQSDQNGLEIMISCKKDADKEIIIKYLLKHTDLQKNYNFNIIAINNRRPQQLGLLAILEAFLMHRRTVILNRSNYRLERAHAKLHILEGLIQAIANLDEIISIIRNSKNKGDSKQNIIAKFGFTAEQAEAIVMMQLYRLSNTDMITLEENYAELQAEVKKLTEIINSPVVLKNLITKELEELLTFINTKRKTKVEAEIEKIEIDKTDLIKEENTVISISAEGYIKRATWRSYLASSVMSTRLEGDMIVANLSTTTKEIAAVFMDDGTVVTIPVYEIAESKWKDIGKHISTYSNINDGVKVKQMICLNEQDANKSLIGISRGGYVMHTTGADLLGLRMRNKSLFQKLKAEDELIDVIKVELSSDPLLTEYLMTITQDNNYVNVPIDKFESGKMKRVGKKIAPIKTDVVGICKVTADGVLILTDKGGYFKVKADALIQVNRPQPLFNNFKTNPHQVIKIINPSMKEIVLINENETIVNIDELKHAIPGEKLKVYDKKITDVMIEIVLDLGSR